MLGAGSVQRLDGDEGDVVVQPPVIAPLAGAGLVAVAQQPLAGTATAAWTGCITRPAAPARYTPTTRPIPWTLTAVTGRQLPLRVLPSSPGMG